MSRRQVDDLLRYLRDRNEVTALDALRLLGIGRLAARVNDLRRAGWPVESRMVEVDVSGGGRARVARYRLSDRPQGHRPGSSTPGNSRPPAPGLAPVAPGAAGSPVEAR